MTKQEFNDIIVKRRQDGDVMKTIRSFAGVLLSVILIIASVTFPTSAQTNSVETMANLIVFVKFPEDTTSEITDNSQKIMMYYNDTSKMYVGSDIDFSFKKYITEISRGKLNVNNIFPQLEGDKITPLTLAASHDNSNDNSVIQEIVAAFNSGKIKMPEDKLDNKYSGVVDNLTVIIQGKCPSGSDFMWPHKSVTDVSTKIKKDRKSVV